MAIIHIADPAGQQTQHSEYEARQRWTDGRIAPNSLYWRHGMPEWRPATEYFEGVAPPKVEVEVPPLPPPTARRFAKDSGSLTRFVIFMLRAYLATAVVAILLSSVSLATGRTNRPQSNDLSPWDATQAVFALIQLAVLVATGTGFLRWIHRAHVNTRTMGATGLKYSPGWAIGWFFVPILNLWKPLNAMKQLWQASSNPDSWRSEPPAPMLNTWWTLWLLSNILGQISIRLSLGGDPGDAVTAEYCALLASLADIPLSLLAIRLVASIHQLQSSWLRDGPFLQVSSP